MNSHMELQLDDYQNLLALLEDKRPLWDLTSLQRCVHFELVNRTGRWLTRAGERKAKRLQIVIAALKQGLPLECRIADRSSDLENEPWYRSTYKNTAVFFNSHALFSGGPPSPGTKVDFKNRFRDVKYEITGYLASTIWTKLDPFAVQTDQLGGMELICFQSIFDKAQLRVQSKYYDYCLARWKQPSFWYRPGHMGPIAVKIPNGGIRNRIVAILQPVSLDQPFPQYNRR